MPYVSAAGNPGLTGVEVSMTTRSHAKELCLSMVTVSVAVLGLVLLARIAGGSLSHVGIPNLDSNASTGILLGRGANETVYVHTTTPVMLAPPPVVCNLSRCLEDGTNIAGLLSWDSDPCVDFYDFACSRWMQARAASASVVGGASASVVEDMERDVEQRVPRLLAAVRAPEFAPLRRLHDTCNDVNAINAAGWAPLAELLRICGLPHWPYEQPATISPWKAAARALQYTGAEAFMSLEVAPHPLRINRTISALDRPLLVLRPSDLAEQDVHWLEDTADTVMTAFRERPRHLARESVAMAIQIARLTYSRDALSDVRLYRVVHLGPFPQLLEFLSTLFANLSSVHASSEVLLRAEGFLRDLLDLADEHKNRALLNYVGLQVAVHSSAFLPDAGGLQAVHGRVLFPHEPPGGYVPRERLCARQVASTMPFLFFYAVRVLFGGEATVRALTAALETLRRHLAEHLSKLALTDYATRVQLVSIVKATRFHVLGPPVVTNESHVLAHARALPTAGDDEPLLWFARITAHVTQLRHMRLSRYVWRGGAFDRDCSSDLQANAVFVPPLFLNASATLDRSLLALQAPHLGARFARCLLLMLLAGVSNRGNRELVTRGWWSDTSKSALGALRRCLARPAGPDDEHDGEGSTAEKAPLSRVAEALAVPPALDAFTEGVLVLAGQGRTLRLPRVEDLTPAQLFFDYYALSRCRRGQHHWRGGGAAADEVNGALRQSAAFHEAFECARGRPMNRVAPCDLWA
ncbi:neprilysin-11 [Dermacentor silvarum]|uniref:neprilysin-11 n=1 Tax=Dermacentor silvarum TaxID=543639 RepID=UPI00189745BE|nr:neprilysin-11 [Dermacentor silvarum]